MLTIVPHIHTCEVKLCRLNTWAENCPLKGKLSDTEDECEHCDHFVTIDFDPDNPMCMTNVIRA